MPTTRVRKKTGNIKRLSACHSNVTLRALERMRPGDRQELARFVERGFGLRVPGEPMVDGHDAPLDYLEHAFFERGDCVVWANRGGGKTMLGAVATLLDLLFKPGIQVRILGGSLEQSAKMYGYLRQLCDTPPLVPLLRSSPTQRRIELTTGSAVELLAQSQRSVRGTRVHRLRCDEVDEFLPEVWDAAQLVTRSEPPEVAPPPEAGSKTGATSVRRPAIRGSIEALSTMHRPFGLMAKLTEENSGFRVFRWGVLDVIETCPPARDCATCAIEPDCQGRAKQARGFVPVEDVITQRGRVSDEVWQSEMLCRRPRRSDTVYPSFDPDRHVRAWAALYEDTHSPRVTPARGRAGVAGGLEADRTPFTPVGGMDFGLRSPLVMLWLRLWNEPDDGRDAPPRVHVMAEYCQSDRTLPRHIDAIETLGHDRPQWIAVDPAGEARNSQTGLTDTRVLRDRGHTIKARRSRIHEGIERIRTLLDHGRLTVEPGCTQLIEALSTYHFDIDRPDNANPVKDGPDHLCDALRYGVMGVNWHGGTKRRKWA